VERPPLAGLAEGQQQIATMGYTLGAGDSVRISVYDNPDLSQDVTLAADGAFQYPLIGRVQAGGLTVRQLEALLTQRLADGYLVSPQVGVTVGQYKSQHVYVIGAVKAPGAYPLQRQATLLEILSQVGGPTSEAGFEVIVVRATDQDGSPSATPDLTVAAARQTAVHVQLEQLLAGRLPQQVFLSDGDVVYVPAGAFFYVAGEIQRPGRYRLERDTTVFKAIAVAGGFSKFAATKTVIVQRLVDGQRRDFQASLQDLLQADDIVVVPASLF
jgi:polysaccharide export outer membrane protein